jgi:hypothetical protein
MAMTRLRQSAERLVYRVAGLPIALKPWPNDPLRSAFARRYWRPSDLAQAVELAAAIALWPFAVAVASIWFTRRNGPVIRARTRERITAQFGEQLKLYLSDGILAPWYYIFSLHDDGAARAPTFLQRFETKTCYFRILKPRKGSPLQNKTRFAAHCAAHGIRTVDTIMSLEGGAPAAALPDRDLFVKPRGGRGGRGAERWDRIAPGRFRRPGGEQLTSQELLERLVSRSRDVPLIVQPRLSPHPHLARITTGALPTLRVLTCLGESAEPEVMAAMIRTSFGANQTVDNLHAGGIGALVDVVSGRLGLSSNLGADARLGWFSNHPDTGVPIEGLIVPCWEEVKASAIAAHRSFADRIVVGWDIAVLEDGPIIIEGNGNPDLDILQRFMRIGLREHRFAALLAHHLQAREMPQGGLHSASQATAK